MISSFDFLWLMTKPQQIILVTLFSTMVIQNIKMKLYILKLTAMNAERTWPLFVQSKILKSSTMCMLPYI